jgi:hypothetical protein
LHKELKITDILGRYATTKYESHFLFDSKITKVNHKCNDCGCIFVDEYKDGRKSREISDSLFWGVISFIASVFMMFSLVCAINCSILAEQSFLLISWILESALLFAGFFVMLIVCLGGY